MHPQNVYHIFGGGCGWTRMTFCLFLIFSCKGIFCYVYPFVHCLRYNVCLKETY